MSDNELGKRMLLLTKDQLDVFVLQNIALKMASLAFEIPPEAIEPVPVPASATCATCRWWCESVRLGDWHAYGCSNGVTDWDTPDEDRGCARTDCTPKDHATDFGCVRWEPRK